jgi:hypothetical protein
MRKLWGGVVGLLLVSVLGVLMLGAREEEIDGTVDPDRIADQDAWEMMFLTMRIEKGSWDLDTIVEWLSESGLTRLEIQQVQARAQAYWREIAPLDEQIREAVAARTAFDRSLEQTINQIVAVKRAKLDGQVAGIHLDLAPDRSDRLRGFLRDTVKRNTTVRTAQRASLLPIAWAQAMGGAITVFTAVTTSGTWFTSKGVANTNGQFGHTTKLTTTALQSFGPVSLGHQQSGLFGVSHRVAGYVY